MVDQRFYEGKFTSTDTWNLKKWFLSLFYQKLARQKLFNRHIRKNPRGKILDIGCGGGSELFASKGRVTGLDLSNESLFKAKKLYESLVCASCTNIPLNDESFDFIVSSDLLGHLPSADKDKAISEIYRILKPGGLTLHYIELDCENPNHLFAKRYPGYYKKYFIEQDGHYGLESGQKNIDRFERCGFKIKKIYFLYKLPFDTQEFTKRFDNEYLEKNSFLKVRVVIARLVNKFRPVKAIVNIFGGLLFDFLGLFAPKRYSGGLFIVCQKPNRAPTK